MELKKFSLLLVLLIALSATLTLSEESVEDDAVAGAAAEGTEEADEAEKDDAEKDEAGDEASDEEEEEEDDVLALTTKTFESVVNDKDIILVEFYAPWFVDIYCSYTDTNPVF